MTTTRIAFVLLLALLCGCATPGGTAAVAAAGTATIPFLVEYFQHLIATGVIPQAEGQALVAKTEAVGNTIGAVLDLFQIWSSSTSQKIAQVEASAGVSPEVAAGVSLATSTLAAFGANKATNWQRDNRRAMRNEAVALPATKG